MQRILLRMVLFLCALSTVPAFAQIGVYGEFSAANFNLPHEGWEYGTTFGIFDDRWGVPFFRVGIDGRASVVRSGDVHTASGLVGPRLVFKPHVLPFMPYVEALGGVGHVSFDQGYVASDGNVTAFSDQTKFQYGFIGGIDWTIIPRIDWRVAEFSYGGLSGFNGSFNPKTLSTGIVFRLP